MGQSRPLFVYFSSFLITISIQIEKSINGVLGIQTRSRRMVGTDETMELWRPHLNRIIVGQVCPHCQFSPPTVLHKNGVTYPPINTRGTGQKKSLKAGTNPHPSFLFFHCGWFTSAIFIIRGQTLKLKAISSPLT